jgi:hypothetical protein
VGVDGGTVTIELNHVCYVSSFAWNVFSAQLAAQRGARAEQWRHMLTFKGKDIIRLDKIKGLDYLPVIQKI